VTAAPIMISMIGLPTSTLTNASSWRRASARCRRGRRFYLKELTFTVAKSRELTLSGSDGASLRPVGNSTNLAGTATFDTCNDQSVQCSITVRLVQDFTIPAGTFQAFDLRLNVMGNAAGSYLNTSVYKPAEAGPWTLASELAAPVGFAVPVITMAALPSTVLSYGTVTRPVSPRPRDPKGTRPSRNCVSRSPRAAS